MSIEIYVPSAATITNITNSKPCVITTALPHGYSAGIYCTIVIPYPKVMEEINGKTYFMVPLSPTQLVPLASIIPSPNPTVVFLDTTNIGAFSLGPLVTCTPHQPTPAVRVPPGPIPPVVPVVPFQVPAQKSQVVPSGEIATTLKNASDVIGPRNLP